MSGATTEVFSAPRLERDGAVFSQTTGILKTTRSRLGPGAESRGQDIFLPSIFLLDLSCSSGRDSSLRICPRLFETAQSVPRAVASVVPADGSL